MLPLSMDRLYNYLFARQSLYTSTQTDAKRMYEYTEEDKQECKRKKRKSCATQVCEIYEKPQTSFFYTDGARK